MTPTISGTPELSGGAGPIFTGGTGRSGTTIMGELLGRHPDLALIPVEMRFHVDGGGLTDLAQGEIDVATFEEKLRTRWYRRTPNRWSGPRGVHVVADESVLDAALAGLHERYAQDPWVACAQFMSELMQAHTEGLQARTWVEMTPPNAKRAGDLCHLYPGARVIHMVRDGRDVAASVAPKSWGPNDIRSALKWWGQQMIELDRSMRSADPARVRTVRLESLVVGRREQEYAELLEFLGLPDAEPMRRFFNEVVTPGSMHPGRWRKDLEDDEIHEVEALYERVLAKLEANGVDAKQA